MPQRSEIIMNCCRICLTRKKPLCPLFRYQAAGNFAEMLTAIADVKVTSDDGLPDKLCSKCCTALERAFLVKITAERSDRRLRQAIEKKTNSLPIKKISFDSFTEVQTEIAPLAVKTEPKWEFEIDFNNLSSGTNPIDTIIGKDIVIANTVIKKVDGATKVESADESADDTADVTWNLTSSENPEPSEEPEYLNEDIFQDDIDDEDYVPPTEKHKDKFKKPKLSDIKVFKDKKIVKTIKIIKKVKGDKRSVDSEKMKPSTLITCYPITKNGSRGAPILLKRPKDSTVSKIHPDRGMYNSGSVRVIRRDKTVRVLPAARTTARQKEKMVCPVCGILTFTLGNHIAIHEEKKKYTCSQCPRTFSQKSNLQTHMKHHTGVRDHICEICGASFYTQKSLVRHNLIHKGERPYSCELCNKKFIANQSLSIHMRTHTGEKPFTCSYCNKSFNQKHHLRNHIIIHTGNRPFRCEVCNVAFSYKVNLNNHVSKVHGINLKFKSIHTVTEEVIRREIGEDRVAISHLMPHLVDPPAPAAHETIGVPPLHDYCVQDD